MSLSSIEGSKKSELSLLNYELNRAQAIAKIGSWSWDSIKGKITWSKELYHIYGLDHRLPAPDYLNHLKLYSLESRKILDRAVKIAIKDGKPYQVQLQLFNISNGIKWVIGNGEVVRNSKGKVVGQRGTIQDITKQKNLEDKILHSSALIESLLDSTPDIIFFKNLNGVYLGCNTSFAEFIGKTKDKIIGKTDHDLFSMEIADTFRKYDKAVLKLNKPNHNEEWITYPDGRKILIDTLKTPYHGPNKEKIGILGISRDITEHKKLEYEVNNNLKQQKFLAEISVDLNQYASFDVVLNDVLKKLAIFTNASRSYIFEDSIDGKSTSNTYEYCAKGVKPQIDNLKNIKYTFIPAFLKGFEEDGIIQSNDVSKMSKDLRAILEPQGIKSILLLPLFIGSRRLGFFGLDITEKNRDWKIDEIHLLKIISNSVSSIYARKEVDIIKSEFISVASHQLKTPLAGIKWMSNLLLDGKIKKTIDQQNEYIKDINYSNERMIKLVSNLLYVSSIESGYKFKIVKKKNNIAKIVDQILLYNKQLSGNKKIKIIESESISKKLILNIDGNKIRQVIDNLITNAIKYSKENGIIEIDCGHKKGEIVFKIKDNGIGIPKEQQNKIFEKFYRADNATKNDPMGTGLGLYITKLMVEAHGGKLWFESKENKGATFYFSLPI